MEHRLRRPEALLATQVVVVGNHQDPVHDRNAKQGNEANRRGNAEVQPGEEQRRHTASDGKRNTGQRHQAVPQRVEQPVQQYDNQQDADRHNQFQPLLGLLQLFEFAGPFDVVALRQLDRFRDALLRLGHGAAQVTPAHAELDRNKALVSFVVDVGSAGVEGNVCQRAERHIGIAAARGLVSHLDIAHGLDVAAVFRRQAHRQRELAVTLQDCRGLRAAERGLYHGIDVSGVKPVACRRLPIDADIEVGLAEHAEHAQVGHALDLVHLVQDLVGQLLQHHVQHAPPFGHVL